MWESILLADEQGCFFVLNVGLEEHHIKNVRKHSTCRRAGMFKFSFFSLCRKRSWLYTIADQSKTLQRPNLSSSCPARCHLSNPDQSRLGEATAEGLTRAAHTCTQLILRIPLVNARFGLGQWILNAPHPKFKIPPSENEGWNWFDWAFVHNNIGWGCSHDADCGKVRYARHYLDIVCSCCGSVF